MNKKYSKRFTSFIAVRVMLLAAAISNNLSSVVYRKELYQVVKFGISRNIFDHAPRIIFTRVLQISEGNSVPALTLVDRA